MDSFKEIESYIKNARIKPAIDCLNEEFQLIDNKAIQDALLAKLNKISDQFDLLNHGSQIPKLSNPKYDEQFAQIVQKLLLLVDMWFGFQSPNSSQAFAELILNEKEVDKIIEESEVEYLRVLIEQRRKMVRARLNFDDPKMKENHIRIGEIKTNLLENSGVLSIDQRLKIKGLIMGSDITILKILIEQKHSLIRTGASINDTELSLLENQITTLSKT